MNIPEAYMFGIEHTAQKAIAYLERNGHNEAEIQLYREIVKQVREIAPIIALGGQDAANRLRPILNAFGEGMKRYLDETAEIRALAPGAAAPAAARLDGALAHLVETTDVEYQWVKQSSSPFHLRIRWHELHRRVTPSDFGSRLDGLASAVGHVAQAAHDADRDLHGTNQVIRAILEALEPAAPAITTIGAADATQSESAHGECTGKEALPVSALQAMYKQLLSDTRNRATDIRKLLKNPGRRVEGPSTYTVRDAVSRAEALVRQTQLEIESLRWAIRCPGLRAVKPERHTPEALGTR